MRRDDTPRLLDPASLLLIAPLCVIGAIIQFLGGPRRQVGVLLATGLLIPFPIAGWAVLAGIAGRIVWQRFANAAGMEVFGAGVIAGDSPFAFFHSAWGAMRKKPSSAITTVFAGHGPV